MTVSYHAGRRIQGLALTESDVTTTASDREDRQTTYSSNGSTMTHYGGEHFTDSKWRNLELKSIVVYGGKHNSSSSGDFKLKVFGSDHTTQIGSTITGTPDVASMPTSGSSTVTFDLTGITSPNTEWFIGVGAISSGGAPAYVWFDDESAGDGSNYWKEYNGYYDISGNSLSFALTYGSVSGDVKPTNVQTGSRFEETDTRKVHDYADPLVLDDDFTSYADTTAGDAAWVTEDVSLLRVNPTNDNIDFKADGSVSSKDKISYDLTSIATLFLSRFSVDFTTMTASGGSGTKAFFGVTEGSVYDSTENHIGFWVREQASTANDMGIKTGVGGDWSSGGATTLFSTVPSVTKYYVELKRTSETSITLSLYSDSSYSSLVETATSTISATGSLRYFSIQTSDSSSASSAIIGSVDDVLFYNGAISTDKYWQEIGA